MAQETSGSSAGAEDGGRRGQKRPWALLGAALLVLGVGVFVLGSDSKEARAAEIGSNRPVNTGATDELDLSAYNSPTVVRSPIRPDQLAVASRIDTPRFSCALNISADAGVTWTRSKVPFPVGEDDPPRCYAPDVAFGADGALTMSFVTLIGAGNTPNALWVVSSTDGGQTFSTPVKVSGPRAFQVRMSAHPNIAGRVYLSWLQADETALHALANTGNPIVSVRSDDGGKTWSAPVRVSPSSRERVVAPSTAMGLDGHIYLSYLDLGDDRLDYHGGHQGKGGPPYGGTWSLVVARSTDDGATWQETVVDDKVVPAERFIVFLPPSPSLAVDGNRVYVAFQDASLGEADVWLWASSDGGSTFGSRSKINDTPKDDATSQYLVRLGVATNGRLDALYYDRRADTKNVMNAVSLQSSGDHGATFGAHMTVSEQPFDSRIGYGSERNLPDLGSRLGLFSADERALALWSDTRAGTPVSGKQDLAMAIVVMGEPGESKGPLRPVGIVLVLAGLGVIVAGLRKGTAQTSV